MVTRQTASAVVKILGHALLDVAAELEDELDVPEPLSPGRPQPTGCHQDGLGGNGLSSSLMHQIGLGGNGPDRAIPECPICYARGGGGHGGFCPNAGKDPGLWVMTPPPGYLRPATPKGREPWL